MVSDACRWWSTRLEKKEVRNLSALTTGEILEKVSDSGIAKAEGRTLRLLIWALLAGAYIAFGAQASQMVSFNLLADPDSLGVGRLVSAAVFPVGLMMVVLCGAELFTGNCLMIIGVLDDPNQRDAPQLGPGVSGKFSGCTAGGGAYEEHGTLGNRQRPFGSIGDQNSAGQGAAQLRTGVCARYFM